MVRINRLVLIAIIAGFVAVLDAVGVIGIPTGIPSVSALYIGAAFFTAFAIWFRIHGLIAIYVGLILGSVISGNFSIFAFFLALGNVIGCIVPLIAFRVLKFDASLKSWKDYAAFIVAVPIGQNIISAVYTLTGFVLVGFMPREAATLAATGWLIGGVIVTIVIGIPLLKSLTPTVKKLGLWL